MAGLPTEPSRRDDDLKNVGSTDIFIDPEKALETARKKLDEANRHITAGERGLDFARRVRHFVKERFANRP